MTDTPDRQETAPPLARPLGFHGGGHQPRVLTWRTVANSAGYLLPHLAAGQSVVDVGVGPGTLTLDLAGRVAPGRVTGLVDTADEAELAAGLAAAVGVANVEFRVGDVQTLPLGDASVDVVHTHQVLQHAANPVAAMREMRRVLRPGGILAARDADYGGAAWYPPAPGLARWHEVYRAVHRFNGGEPDAGRALKAWARQAGFDEVTSTASIWCFASPAEREWWGLSWAERAGAADFTAQAIESGAATLAELRTIAAAWRHWAADQDGWFGLPHGEIIARRTGPGAEVSAAAVSAAEG